MNTDSIREYCLSFPKATEKLQWGDALCFKIGGKMFAVLGLDRVRFTFKCDPESFAELIEREDIVPSPYLARYNWVMLNRLDAVDWLELQQLIQASYEMVSAKVPAKKSKRKNGPSRRAARKNTKKKTRTA